MSDAQASPEPPPPEPIAGEVPPRQAWWKRWWVIALAVVAVLAIIGAIAQGGSDEQQTETVGSEASTTATSDVSAPETTAPPDATTSPTTASGATTPTTTGTSPPATEMTTTTELTLTSPPIPGLQPVDIYLNLEKAGWQCDGPTTGPLFVTWLCKLPGTLAVVEIFSNSGTDVQQVEGNVYAPEEYQWLGFLATVPYDGATPADARAWVESNIPTVQQGQPAEAEFGGVPYLLGGSDAYRFLSIGRLE
jgi:hypothetical protein